MKATGIVRRIDAGVIKTPIKYIAKARWNSPRFLLYNENHAIYWSAGKRRQIKYPFRGSRWKCCGWQTMHILKNHNPNNRADWEIQRIFY